MKCQSIACLWSTCPPSHKVTAFTTLADPSTLYTGGSDGSIVWWNLFTPSTPYPMALLCGHAAEIVDLTVCAPMVHSEIPTPSESLALFSVCGDGVLCVWSRGSGHCRKRRKLPPWAGTPKASVQVRGNPRFVCIACGSEAAEGVDGEVERKRGLNSKVAVLVVDSCSLNIVRTLFNGISELGDVRCVSMVPGLGKDESFALVDAAGRVQLAGVEVKEDARSDGQGNSSLSTSVVGLVPNSNEGADVLSLDVCGKIVVLVYETMCVFKSVITGSVIGDISLAQTPICDEGQLSGCLFLHDDVHECGFNRQELEEGVEELFVLWNKKGTAVIYVTRVLRKNSGFQLDFKSLTMIKGISHKIDEQNSLYFCKLDGYVVRLESFCSQVGGSSLWRPHVTIWSFLELPLHHSISHGESGRELKASASGHTNNLSISALVGHGEFSVSWRENISYNYVNRAGHGTYLNESKTGPKEVNMQEHISDCNENEQAVSSSMVLSEDAYAPYAVVYGFYSGDIEVIRFWDSPAEIDAAGRCVSYHTNRHMTKQSFTGHTGAILCLAAHHMFATPKEHGFCKVLISGSIDCTIRLWDLDNCILLYVLHHHVSPIKQIILPPPQTDTPWCNCFISVGEDSCVALVSLDTLQVERMFPGHPCYPSRVVWDSRRGYLACLCRSSSSLSVTFTALYLWDVKTGALERVFHGAFSYLVFDYFCKGININTITGNILGGSTSSSLLLPVIEDASLSSSLVLIHQKENATKTIGRSHGKSTDVVYSSNHLVRDGKVIPHPEQNISYDTAENSSLMQNLTDSGPHKIKHPIKCSCPFPGIAALKFGLKSLLSSYQEKKHDVPIEEYGKHDQQVNIVKFDQKTNNLGVHKKFFKGTSSGQGSVDFQIKESIEEYLIHFSLCFLHLWGVDLELDKLLMEEMNIRRPEGLFVASGVPGDRGSMVLMFPGLRPALELWKSSSEFCAMRSLTIVSLAQRLVMLSQSSSLASSALAAFYTRSFAENVPDVKPPLLQLLVSFWQDPSEHVRMAARSLFHCAAPRAIPRPIFCKRARQPVSTSIRMHLTEEYPLCNNDYGSGNNDVDSDYNNQHVETDIAAWLESYEMQDWVSCIGGTMQDAMASHIIVASALAVWYPSIVNAKLVNLVVNHLVKLVMSINDRYSSTAAELLAEGMDSTWKTCIAPEVPRLIADIFFQIECLSGVSSTKTQNPALNINIRDALVGILLPSLAMADIPGFLNAIESQIWATSSDSPVHLVSVTTLIRVIRGSPKPLALYLDKVINFVLHTLDHANSVMRKICLQSSMVALKEVARVFPMVALSEANSRLAVADAVGDISDITIRVYDLQSMAKIKVLDANGPPGLPSLLPGSSRSKVIAAISAVSFSLDGEGLVAFSEHGLVIRWWSLGIAWWEKLSRSLVPVQCTKLIFVPPWEGISPNSSRTSMIANIGEPDDGARSPEKKGGELSDADSLRFLINKIDLSYRLDWIDGRKVVLSQHKHELGTFQF